MGSAPAKSVVRWSPAKAIVLTVCAVAFAACSTAPQATKSARTQTKEFFAESEYGVKASPRVSNQRSRLPRGGGRDQVGKPYKVRGQWYHPKEEPNYRAVGGASWYGDAFHGRLTANGEIYDMTHLTAAHPTMPLPSYARVTNKSNNSSVIVRVNDRGPFARGRIVDLSRRAAQLLDYKHAGVAQVEVEYLGRAPLHGQDDAFLMASYRPGGAGRQQPGIDDGLPTGVMIAMNGPTPSGSAATRSGTSSGGQQLAAVAPQARPQAASATFDYSRIESRIGAPQPASSTFSAQDPLLPEVGPVLPERPPLGLAQGAPATGDRLTVLSYADRRIDEASSAFDAFDRGNNIDADRIVAAWKSRDHRAAPLAAPYVAAATFDTAAQAQAMAVRLRTIGLADVSADGDAYVVTLRDGSGGATDALLTAAWEAGASDAMLVRE